MAAVQRFAVRAGVAPRLRSVLLATAVGALLLIAACGEESHPESTNFTAGTITFWIRPDWAGEVDGKYNIVWLGAPTFRNRLVIFKDLAYLRFLFTPDSGIESGASQSITDWRRGDRHMITATWGDGVTALYVDGTSAGENDYDGEINLCPNPPVILGSGGNPGVAGNANSNIRNFQIYDHASSTDEVAALFAHPPS
jgi:hypothetical protein